MSADVLDAEGLQREVGYRMPAVADQRDHRDDEREREEGGGDRQGRRREPTGAAATRRRLLPTRCVDDGGRQELLSRRSRRRSSRRDTEPGSPAPVNEKAESHKPGARERCWGTT